MKKIKTINKLLSSLTLLSPLVGVGFNNQYQNTQKVITENNNNDVLINPLHSNAEPVQMGDITVNVDGTKITGYVGGSGTLRVSSNITEIGNSAFRSNININSLDLSQATSLTTIGEYAFNYCKNLSGDIIIPSSMRNIERFAFHETKITILDLSQATSIITFGNSAFNSCPLEIDLKIPSNVTSIGNFAFSNTPITSLDLSQATSLTTIGESAFQSCSNLTGDLVFPSSVTSIGRNAFTYSLTNISSISIDSSNKYLSFATNLGPDTQVLINSPDGIWKDDFIVAGGIATGNIIIPHDITTIQNFAFIHTNIASLDLSQATSLTSIGTESFYDCSNITGDLVILSSVTTIGDYAFANTSIASLDLSNATNLTTIGDNAFGYCLNLTGDLVIPYNVITIGRYVFYDVTRVNNLYFLSETPPTFNLSWQPTITGKVYVPSQIAKLAYLTTDYFNFSEDQVEIGLPSGESNSNVGLILGLIFGLGIPIILAITFIIWYTTKKKKTTVKI